MFMIEWASCEYSPRWKESNQRFATYDDAASSAADWMVANHEHGVDIQIRITAAEINEVPALAVAA